MAQTHSKTMITKTNLVIYAGFAIQASLSKTTIKITVCSEYSRHVQQETICFSIGTAQVLIPQTVCTELHS